MKRKTKVNKYQTIIDHEVDLHGFSREAARREILETLADAEHNKWKTLRIIVGKGLHSGDGGGVLGPLVKSLLNERSLRYREAKREDGGEGALVVQLF